MNRCLAVILLCWAAGAAMLPGQADTLHFKDGRVEQVTVSEVSRSFVVLKPDNPGGRVRRLDRSDVAFVEFGRRREMDLAESRKGTERLEALRRVWYLMRPSLELPESPAGDWGMRFAGAILESTVEDNVRLSFEVYRTIEQRDWSRARRLDARRGRFNAMLNLGMTEDAMREAQAIATDLEEEDPGLLITAKAMLGDRAFKKLKALQEEHPRWELDDRVRPRRQALVDEALDHYLFPHLYHGDRPEDAAGGLASVVDLLRFAGDEPAARLREQDLMRLYPDTPQARAIEAAAAVEREEMEGKKTPSNDPGQ